MAHHVLPVMRYRPIVVVLQAAPGSIAAVNYDATGSRLAGRLSDQLGFSPFHHLKSG
jgi:hypothetical protein